MRNEMEWISWNTEQYLHSSPKNAKRLYYKVIKEVF